MICGCNCAINIVARTFPSVVFMFFIYLFGCTPAKKGDIVAIPKVYVLYAIAVYTLMHEKNKGRVNPWAFVGYRSMETWLDHQTLPPYGQGRDLDAKYDEVPRSDSMRVSICSRFNKETLLPFSRYREDKDFLGEITSESFGLSGNLVVEIPCICQGVEIVLALKCKRRQVIMRYLSFVCALGFCWSAAHALDFTTFQDAAVAATIDNIIESSHKGKRGVYLVNAFVNLYTPIFEMLKVFLIKAFGGRLPTEEELAVVLDSERGQVRLAKCQFSDSAVSGAAASAAERDVRGKIDALASDIGMVFSPTRVKEIKKATQPGWRGKAWGKYYAVRDGASAALAFAKGGFRRRRADDDDDDCGPSKRLRAGEGMPSAAESAADWDGSCKALEPQGSTNPRSGVRRHLLADISRHQRKNAVYQAPIG